MQQEIEAKFLDQNHDVIRKQLKKLGAVCEHPMRTMRRKIIDYPDRRLQQQEDVWAYIRVRDEGDKNTVTLKQFAKNNLSDAREIEFSIEDFDKMVQIFEFIGLKIQSYQETKRETWLFDGCEVVLDEWPWLKPYIEVEGANEDAIKQCSQLLGLDWQNAVFGDVSEAYRAEYPGIGQDETIGTIPEITFEHPIPDWLAERKRK